MSIVLDANILLREVRWRAQKRRLPDARTDLEELVANGTVVALAPAFAREEVEKYLPTVAANRDVLLADVERIWAGVQKWVRFFHPDDAPLSDKGYASAHAADPKDVPYYGLWRQLGASAIYTRDSHLSQTDAPIVTREIIVSLRATARAASVELTLKFGGTMAVFAGFAAVRSLVSIVVTLADTVRRLPNWAKLGLGAALAGLLIHPRSRSAILTTLKRAPERFIEVCSELAPHYNAMFQVYEDSTRDNAERWSAVELLVPGAPRLTTRQYARAALTAAADPLTVPELVVAMRRRGHVSASRTFPAYLRQLLRSDSRCYETAPGMWTVMRDAVQASEPAGLHVVLA